jgi:preprotein translocase subunit SecA
MQELQLQDGVQLREFFVGRRDKDVFSAMDRRRDELGATVIRRTKIGRNATCPCGSGRKFKKCCIHKAQHV